MNCFAPNISVKKVRKIMLFVSKNLPKQFTLAVIVDVLVLGKWNLYKEMDSFCYCLPDISLQMTK